MLKFLNFIVVIISLIIIISFFLPWISIQPRGSSTLNRMFYTQRLVQFKKISGFEIPQLANSSHSKIIIKVLEIFTGKRRNLDKKSYWVYIIPGLGIFFIFLTRFRKNYSIISLIFLIIGLGIYLYSLYKINTANLNLTVIKVSIGNGLKYIQYSFLITGIIGLIRLIFPIH